MSTSTSTVLLLPLKDDALEQSQSPSSASSTPIGRNNRRLQHDFGRKSYLPASIRYKLVVAVLLLFVVAFACLLLFVHRSNQYKSQKAANRPKRASDSNQNDTSKTPSMKPTSFNRSYSTTKSRSPSLGPSASSKTRAVRIKPNTTHTIRTLNRRSAKENNSPEKTANQKGGSTTDPTTTKFTTQPSENATTHKRHNYHGNKKAMMFLNLLIIICCCCCCCGYCSKDKKKKKKKKVSGICPSKKTMCKLLMLV